MDDVDLGALIALDEGQRINEITRAGGSPDTVFTAIQHHYARASQRLG
jgi:hypothetical protein